MLIDAKPLTLWSSLIIGVGFIWGLVAAGVVCLVLAAVQLVLIVVEIRK